MVPAVHRDALVKDMVRRLRHKGPVFAISALTREGCEGLMQAIYLHIRKIHDAEVAGDQPMDPRFAQAVSIVK
jgi:GTP-binding protein